jgi:hypothetical protein
MAGSPEDHRVVYLRIVRNHDRLAKSPNTKIVVVGEQAGLPLILDSK